MSSNSSIATFLVWLTSLGLIVRSTASETSDAIVLSRKSLHLVEHGRERGLQLEGLFDFCSARVWIFRVFEEARALVNADKLDDRRRICLPVHRKTLEILEHRPEASDAE